jgi:hypothetical protein
MAMTLYCLFDGLIGHLESIDLSEPDTPERSECEIGPGVSRPSGQERTSYTK